LGEFRRRRPAAMAAVRDEEGSWSSGEWTGRTSRTRRGGWCARERLGWLI
jgi:hypothetical protein